MKILRSVLGWAAIAAVVVVILTVLAPFCADPPERAAPADASVPSD